MVSPHPKLQALLYDILPSKVPESEAQSVLPTRPHPYLIPLSNLTTSGERESRETTLYSSCVDLKRYRKQAEIKRDSADIFGGFSPSEAKAEARSGAVDRPTGNRSTQRTTLEQTELT